MPQVELVYDAACPNPPNARAQLSRAFARAGLAAHWKEWRADDPEAPPVKPTEAPDGKRIGLLPDGVGIAVGERAPDATVLDWEGREVRLRDLASKGPTLLVFYRGGWCPFCNFQIRELAIAYPELEARGVTPIAISVDRIEESARTRATYEIAFPVLSDPDLVAHRAYRVLHHAEDAEVSRLRGFGMDLEKASGRDHHVIAVPSVFAIDREGFVRWAHADPNYRVRPTTRQLLEVLDGLGWRR